VESHRNHLRTVLSKQEQEISAEGITGEKLPTYKTSASVFPSKTNVNFCHNGGTQGPKPEAPKAGLPSVRKSNKKKKHKKSGEDRKATKKSWIFSRGNGQVWKRKEKSGKKQGRNGGAGKKRNWAMTGKGRGVQPGVRGAEMGKNITVWRGGVIEPGNWKRVEGNVEF